MASTDARDRTFGLNGPKDLFEKLVWENNQIRQLLAAGSHDSSIDSAYFSLNAAATAWHIVDWVIADLDERKAWPVTLDGESIVAGPKLRDHMLSRSSVRVIQQIANAWKHRSLDRTYEPGYKAENLLVEFVYEGEPASLRFLAVHVPDQDEYHIRNSEGLIEGLVEGPIDIRLVLDNIIERWGDVLKQLSYIE